jgi:hypothetical protein
MKKVFLVSLILFLSSCAAISRGQKEALLQRAEIYNERIKLNESIKVDLVNTYGANSVVIRVLDQNTRILQDGRDQLYIIFDKQTDK